MNTHRIRIATAMTAFAAGAAILSACTSTDPATATSAATSTTAGHEGHGAASSMAPSAATPASPSSAAAAFNDADVDFATMMYPHHAQAIEMADLVDGKEAGPDVVALAKEIKGAQQPEMDAFTRLLAQWGKPAPSATGHGGHAMAGMMTQEQMDRLKALRGTAFDREWLTMMIEHHKGAIEMADTEIRSGVNPENKRIAQDIKAGQQAEIERMQKLLG